MKKLTFVYPGDPPCECLVLTRVEFFEIFPPQGRTVRVLTGSGVAGEAMHLESEIPMGEQIVCDTCGDDINGVVGEVIWLVRKTRAYCRTCAEKHVLPWCDSNPN